MRRFYFPGWVLAGFGAAILGVVLLSVLAFATNYQQLGNLVRVISLIRTHYLEEVPSSRLVEGAIRGMVGALDDPYSVYLDPQTYTHLTEQIEGSFGGLGILVGLKDQKLTVIKPFAGTPAARAGIRSGDTILKINDVNARGIDLETALTLMRGPVGSKVALTIQREGEPAPLRYELTREEIQIPTVEARIMNRRGLAYIAITTFTEKTGREFNEALARMHREGMRGLILDLRDNPGGELQAAVDVADAFLSRGPIVYIAHRARKNQVFYADPQRTKLPLIVLVNEGTASAAEIVAGAIKDAGVGVLVGTRTYGKGVVQTLFPLNNGAGVKLTTARYLTPNKHDLNQAGITPDVLVKQPENAAEDVQLQRAVAILEAKL
ncbi:MAG: Periplasmic protease [Clostridia bacterium 62_21]|nr:MAG: Periplasmic protease [Clostridia bacterium 62_21]